MRQDLLDKALADQDRERRSTNWKLEAQILIDTVLDILPRDASIDTMRETLEISGPVFHCGSPYGKAVWNREIERVIARHR